MAVINGNNADNTIYGTRGNDVISGKGGNDTLSGGVGNDKLYGNGDGDKLYGGIGNDTLQGGLGGDWVWGGDGADRFVFSGDPRDPTTGRAVDNVMDLNWFEGDRIDVRSIDANLNRDGNQAFDWLGERTFTGQAGQARLFIIDTPQIKSTIIEFDRDGDRQADLTIGLPGVRDVPEYAIFL